MARKAPSNEKWPLGYEWLGSISVGTWSGSACRGDTRTTLIFRASRAPSVGNLLAYRARLSGFIYLPQPLTYYLLFHNFNSYCHAALLIATLGNISHDLLFAFFKGEGGSWRRGGEDGGCARGWFRFLEVLSRLGGTWFQILGVKYLGIMKSKIHWKFFWRNNI